VEELRFAVLGDSLAAGTGAARAADGLGPRLAAGLRAGGVATALDVVAVPGAVSPGLAAQVERARAGRPGLALVVIGGNDLVHGVPAADSAAHLRRAVGDLREAGAVVVVVPVPDLSVVAHVPAQLRDLVRGASSALRAAQSAAVAAVGGRVLEPSAGLTARFAAEPALFSADRFHPSSEGYAVLAAEFLPAVREAAGAGRARAAGQGG